MNQCSLSFAVDSCGGLSPLNHTLPSYGTVIPWSCMRSRPEPSQSLTLLREMKLSKEYSDESNINVLCLLQWIAVDGCPHSVRHCPAMALSSPGPVWDLDQNQASPWLYWEKWNYRKNILMNQYSLSFAVDSCGGLSPLNHTLPSYGTVIPWSCMRSRPEPSQSLTLLREMKLSKEYSDESNINVLCLLQWIAVDGCPHSVRHCPAMALSSPWSCIRSRPEPSQSLTLLREKKLYKQ